MFVFGDVNNREGENMLISEVFLKFFVTDKELFLFGFYKLSLLGLFMADWGRFCVYEDDLGWETKEFFLFCKFKFFYLIAYFCFN